MFTDPWDKLKEVQQEAFSNGYASATYRDLEVTFNGGLAYYWVNGKEVTTTQAVDYLTFL